MISFTATGTAFQHVTLNGQTVDRFQPVRARSGEYYLVDLANASVVETSADLQLMTEREAHDLQQEYLYS
jgi:ribosomal 30S subunit maturation factor RimM